MSMGPVTGLLISPITWAHHLVWIIPIVLWLALAHDRPAYGRIWAAVAAGLFWYGAIWHIPHGKGVELHDSTVQLIVGDSYTLLMLLFVAGMITMLALRHNRRRPLPGIDIGGTLRSPSGLQSQPQSFGSPLDHSVRDA